MAERSAGSFGIPWLARVAWPLRRANLRAIPFGTKLLQRFKKGNQRSKVFVLYVDRLHSFVDHRFRGLSQNAAQPSGVVFLSNAEQSRCRRRSAYILAVAFGAALCVAH